MSPNVSEPFLCNIGFCYGVSDGVSDGVLIAFLSRQMMPPLYSLSGMPPNIVHASLVAALSLSTITVLTIINTKSIANTIIALLMNRLNALSIVVVL